MTYYAAMITGATGLGLPHWMSISRSLNSTVPTQAALHLPWLHSITLPCSFTCDEHEVDGVEVVRLVEVLELHLTFIFGIPCAYDLHELIVRSGFSNVSGQNDHLDMIPSSVQHLIHLPPVTDTVSECYRTLTFISFGSVVAPLCR